MKLFKIYTYKDEVLHQKATEVSLPISEEERNRLLDRVEYLKKSQDDDFADEHAYDKKDYKEEMNCFFYRVAKHVHEDKL